MNKIPNPKPQIEKAKVSMKLSPFFLSRTRARKFYAVPLSMATAALSKPAAAVSKPAHAIVRDDGDIVIAATALVNYDGDSVIRAYVTVNAARRNVIYRCVKVIHRNAEVIYILDYLRLNFAKLSSIAKRGSISMRSKILSKPYKQMSREGQMLIAQRLIVGLNMKRNP